MEVNSQLGFSAVVLGATGTLGRALVAALNQMPQCVKITVIVPSVLEEWTTDAYLKLNMEGRIIEIDALEDLHFYQDELNASDVFY